MAVVSEQRRPWQSKLTRRPLPVVAALGGISASADVSAWWPGVVRAGGCVDPRDYHIVGMDWLDGGEGADGRPLKRVTTHDQADALAAALDAEGISCLRAIVGASYGGMVALAFAERYPTRVEHVVAISAAAHAHPMSTALRSLQRRVVELGIETNRAAGALSIARGIATTTYRSAAEFAERFGAAPEFRGDAGAEFPVEAYLRHQGEKFAAAFTPARFLALSLSADLHRIEPSRIAVPATFVAARGDAIVPVAQMDELAARWGGPSCLIELPARTGHDAFLAEQHLVGPVLRETLQRGNADT